MSQTFSQIAKPTVRNALTTYRAAWHRSGTSPPSAAPSYRSQHGQDRTASSHPSGLPPLGSPASAPEASPLPSAGARQRRTVEHQRVLEKLLAAEVLEVRVLHPAIAQSLVGKVVSVLEDR